MNFKLTIFVTFTFYFLIVVRCTEDKVYYVNISSDDVTTEVETSYDVNTRSEDDSGKETTIFKWPRKLVEDLLSYIAKHWSEEIIPGTKYCGKGNISTGFDDIGFFKGTDKCCRQHDMCSDLIEPGASSHGLVNNDKYTRLNCNCDQRFLECLKEDNSKRSSSLSQLVGFAYFNMLNDQCFQEDYPIVQCIKYYPEWYVYGELKIFPLAKKCEEYELNKSAEKKYQYFDPPRF